MRKFLLKFAQQVDQQLGAAQKGHATVMLDAKLSAKERVEKTSEIVAELLKNFPPSYSSSP